MSLVECTGILPPTAMTPYSPTFRYLLNDKGICAQHNVVHTVRDVSLLTCIHKNTHNPH
jgi:hypothetical protein